MRDPTRLPIMKFALDSTMIERLHELADQRNMSVSTLLRDMVYRELNTATRQEIGDHEPHTRQSAGPSR
jgi:Ribbon-helix-helix protein, copG family